MSGMFARIRWHLVGWTMLVVGLILVVLGGLVYAAMSRSLLDQVDRDLASRADQAAANLAATAGGGSEEERERYGGGVFYLVVAPDGTVLANPQRVDVRALPPFAHPLVVVASPARGRGTLLQGARLVVGESLEPERAALRTLLLILGLGGAAGLLLSFAGAWFLAGRALVPIQIAFRRQQEFVADASHELRTPLTVLRSATDVLNQHRDEPLSANAELFDDVREDIGRLQRLTADLLTLARSDRGQLELAVAPLDAGDLAGEVVRRLGPLAQERGVELALEASTDDLTVEADPDRLQQVLVILADNALKHTPAGGRVTVAVRRLDGRVAVEVADTGSGIAPEHLPRVFERFYRADGARGRANGGTGLGLAIARSLVEAHGGEIKIASTVGAGTRVTVLLDASGRPASLGARLGDLAARVAQRG
jgi:two-component system sensor histidine kinase CiaH